MPFNLEYAWFVGKFTNTLLFPLGSPWVQACLWNGQKLLLVCFGGRGVISSGGRRPHACFQRLGGFRINLIATLYRISTSLVCQRDSNRVKLTIRKMKDLQRSGCLCKWLWGLLWSHRVGFTWEECNAEMPLKSLKSHKSEGVCRHGRLDARGTVKQEIVPQRCLPKLVSIIKGRTLDGITHAMTHQYSGVKSGSLCVFTVPYFNRSLNLHTLSHMIIYYFLSGKHN